MTNARRAHMKGETGCFRSKITLELQTIVTLRHALAVLLAGAVFVDLQFVVLPPAAVGQLRSDPNQQPRLRSHRAPRLVSLDESKLAERLNDPITVNFLDEPLRDALEYVSEIQRLKLGFDEATLAKANANFDQLVAIS